jgi:hypothetical protein
MKAKSLTKAEKDWLKKLQNVMDECPSNRLAAYTIGDRELNFYDSRFDDQITYLQNSNRGVARDFGPCCEQLGVYFCAIRTPFCVTSAAG